MSNKINKIINWRLFGLLHSQWLFLAMRKDHWERNEPIRLLRDQKASWGTTIGNARTPRVYLS
jgi:hypothetical protein